MKALFIPLLGIYFDQFEAGTKTEEIRVHGPRWNARTCPTGRRVTLSRGYGTYRRLHGSLVGIRIEQAGFLALSQLPEEVKGQPPKEIIFIRIQLDPRPALASRSLPVTPP